VIGHTIAHYTLKDKIGAGGMGEVYRATDSKLHRDVAIKVIPEEFARDPERMARFEREAQVLASLTHGGIAAVYGIEESNGHRALVMELVEGEDLSARLKRGPLPQDEALRTAIHIAEALEAAHDRGVIHRDLKPANIKVLPSGQVKLLDFGLAKALDDSSSSHLTAGEAATLSVAATRAGLVLGTAAYMSPEQATGSPADRRSDVWSFGVVLFEMLTGQRLFDGQTTSHVLADVIRAEIDFNRLPATVSPELRTLLERALERDPRRRLRDIHDARLTLERLVERGTGTHTALRSGSVPIIPPGPTRPRNIPAWALGAVALAAIAAAVMVWQRPAPPAAPQLRVAARLADVPFYESGVGPNFDLSPDGAQIAMVVAGSVEDSPKLVVRRLHELDFTTLVDPGSGSTAQGRPYAPFFSPDGAWIGYALPGELKKVPAAGGTPLTICKVDRSRGASWGPDGTIVLAPSSNSGLFKVSAAGGEPQPLTTLNAEAKEFTHRWPQILPGGREVLFTSHSSNADFGDAVLEIVRLDTGVRTVIHRGGSYGRYVPSGHIVYLQQGTLFAAPFDLGRMQIVGPPAPAVQNVVESAAGAAHFTFANSGLLAYRQRAIEIQVHPIVWVDRAGRSTTLLEEPGTYASPRLSPDGKRLSLTVLKNRNWDIWVYDLDRSVATRLTFEDAPETEQIWSPDGRDLVYAAEEANNVHTLYRKRSDGSGAPTPLLSTKEGMWPQSWSPDGRSIAVTGAANNNDIGIVTVTGDKGEINWILNSRFGESDPAFSPDGRWLAYTSNESGQIEVYIRQFPTGSGRWQVSHGGGGFPHWSRNGREIVYRTADGLAAATVDAQGDSLRTGTPQRLFTGSFVGGVTGLASGGYVFADFEPAADGSRFVMFPKAPDKQAVIGGVLTLVTNWFGDLPSSK
jgi:Tol biopolymer transport system component